MKRYIFATILFSLSLFSDTYYPLNYGLYVGGNANFHSPDFNLEPNPFNNTTFIVPFDEANTSLGLNIGGVINYPIDSMFTLTGRIGFHNLNSQFNNSFAWNVDGTNGLDTLSNYSLDNSLSYLEFMPGVQVFNLIPVDNLYLLGGLELGFPITLNSKYTQDISEIDGAIQTDPAITDTRTIDDNDADASARFAIAIGAGYTFRISQNWLLSPELSYRIPVTTVSSSNRFDTWSVPQLRFGINLTFGRFTEKEPEIPSELSVLVDGPYSYDRNASKYKVDNLKVEEVKYTELFPMLPYVFFDENKSDPRADVQVLSTETGEFSIDNLEADAMSINKNTIDIIGSRLKNSESEITITGTTDGKKEAKTVAKKRAEFARDYLVVNYGVDPNRIKTKFQDLPNKASSPKIPDGIEENRRIEFSTNDANLLNPISIELERQTFASPNLIEFNPKINTTDSIKSWNFEITQEDRLVKRFAGTGDPKNLQWAVLPNDLARTKVPIDYTFYAENVKGKDDQISGSIPVDYFSTSRKESEKRSDKEISKFSLVVFDFDSPEISFIDKEILKKNVIPSINPKSIIQIYGYADRIGQDGYNKKLSLKRAEAVKKYIEPYAKSNVIEVYGIGENIELYDNNLPTGRQLSRTVQIYVITPKN
ncbi:OmpA family protein [Candidatus Kapabacteria bacterium]|nr:OmpA family protein [Candidatus Kapabacteria bacterium]